MLGYPADDPRRVTAKRALQKLLVIGPTSAYCQPCVSPVWDTALACLAMQEAGCDRRPSGRPARSTGCRPSSCWTSPATGRSTVRACGRRLGVPVRERLLPRSRRHRRGRLGHASGAQHAPTTPRACAGRSTGWSACRARTAASPPSMPTTPRYYLNKIPFADHGALLDPPTSDVTARVVAVLARVGRPQDRRRSTARSPTCAPSRKPDGSWFGRWGTNYIYGTWSVLTALAQAGVGSPGSGRAPGGRLADGAAERRRRLGREQRQLRDPRDGATPAARMCRARRIRPRGRCWRCSPRAKRASEAVRRGVDHLHAHPAIAMACGATRTSPRRASRGCSISSTTATAAISRSGRSPPTAR